MATQATSVELNMFKHQAKTMATQAASVEPNMFKHQAKTMATQAAPVELNMFNYNFLIPFLIWHCFVSLKF
jgi:hypothetical protein